MDHRLDSETVVTGDLTPRIITCTPQHALAYDHRLELDKIRSQRVQLIDGLQTENRSESNWRLYRS